MPLPIIAGGSPEATLVSKFVINNVGGTVVGKREINRQMVGGWMEGGQCVEVQTVFDEKELMKIRGIIADKASANGLEFSLEDIPADKRFQDIEGYESQLIDDISLEIESEYLQNRNIPEPMIAVIRTARDIWEALNILRLQESPIAGVSLADAKVQLSNGWMYEKAERERALWRQGKTEEQIKKGWGGDQYIKEMSVNDLKVAEPR